MSLNLPLQLLRTMRQSASDHRCWLLALSNTFLMGCDPQARPAGSYWLPQAVVGVRLDTAEDASAARRELLAFAQRSGLTQDKTPHPIVQPPRTHDDIRRARRAEFAPPFEVRAEGFDLVLEVISDRCWIVQMHDRSGDWSQKSVNAFYELHRVLNAATHAQAHMLVRPTLEQNASYEPPGGVARTADPQQPAEVEEFCVRMGLSGADAGLRD